MKDKLLMILFVLILGTILSTALVSVNYYTEPLVLKNAELKSKRTVLSAFNIPYEKENIETIFDQNIFNENGFYQVFHREDAMIDKVTELEYSN